MDREKSTDVKVRPQFEPCGAMKKVERGGVEIRGRRWDDEGGGVTGPIIYVYIKII